MADIVSNPKARRDYAVLETVEAGIVLRGTEVKSLRAGCGQLNEAYAVIQNGEAWLHNAHIDEYAQGNRQNHQPKAVRRLLLHQSEIRRLADAANVKGHALIPLALYWNNGKVKVALGVCHSKRQYDKREQIKQRESDQQLRRLAMHKQ